MPLMEKMLFLWDKDNEIDPKIEKNGMAKIGKLNS